MFYGKDQLYFNLVNLMIQFIMFCEFTWLDILILIMNILFIWIIQKKNQNIRFSDVG